MLDQMLVLEVEIGGTVVIETEDARQIKLRVMRKPNIVGTKQITIGIEADRDIPIMREELLNR